MEINKNLPIDPQIPPTQDGSPVPAAKSGSSSKFQELLEGLERLKHHTGERNKILSVDPIGELGEAVDQAEEVHKTAMDMKRQREEAFQRHIQKG